MTGRTLTVYGLVLFGLFSSVKAVRAQGVSAWSDDVDTLVRAIRDIHPNPYGKRRRKTFDAAAAAAKERFPKISPHAAALELQRVLAMVGDGHTEWAVLPRSLRGKWLPLIFRRFEEGWFVRTGDPEYRELFGKPITHLAGTPIHEAVEKVLPYVSGENEVGKLDDAADLLRNVLVLDALGIAEGVPERVSVSVLEHDGSETSVSVGVTGDGWVRGDWVDVDKLLNPGGTEPLYRRLEGNYACAWLPEEKLVYVSFSEVRDGDDSTIAEFFKSVYDFARRVKPDKFVLDIRENSGGNLNLNGPVIRGLIATGHVDYPGRFFVVIGPDTYSAAMRLAVVLERYTHATFVGAPTGATPNHFGDTRIVELPNCGINVEISELYWQNSDPRDARPWITPDLPANPSAGTLIAGGDPALEAILRYEVSDSTIESFGPPMDRWQRANQLQAETWPALLAPRARLPHFDKHFPKRRVEACPLE